MCSTESSDPNEDSESDDDTGGRLRQSQRESVMRLDRLKMVVDKMQEVRKQRKILLSRLRDEMDREDKDAAAAGQDDSDVLVEVRGSNLDVSMAVKKKLDDRYGTTVGTNKCFHSLYYITYLCNIILFMLIFFYYYFII